jgi:hypothetical protein
MQVSNRLPVSNVQDLHMNQMSASNVSDLPACRALLGKSTPATSAVQLCKKMFIF